MIHTQACIDALKAYEKFVEEYTTKYPNYCRSCNGNGGIAYPEKWDEPSTTEPCNSCMGVGDCPRCGEHVWDEGSTYDICPKCGWKWDKPEGLGYGPDYCECGLIEEEERL